MWFRALVDALKFRPSGAGARPSRTRPVSRPRLEALEDRAVPAVHTWTGGGEDNLWSNPDNWDDEGVPRSIDPTDTQVAFLGNTSSVMDIVGLEIDLLALGDGNNTITLNTPLTLNPSLGAAGEAAIDADGDTHTITGAQLISGPNALRVALNSPDTTLIVESPISATNLLQKEGPGTLSLRGAQTYSGAVVVFDGTLEVPAGSSLMNSQVVLRASGIAISLGVLAGGGTVGTVSGLNSLRSGLVAPGGGVTTAALTIGNADLTGLTYEPTISGANSDRLNVIGLLDLTDAVLSVRVLQSPTAASYTLIDNAGTDAITGTFSGQFNGVFGNLPEGAALFVGGQAYTISYVGGDGNDVVLTRAGGPEEPEEPPPPPPPAAPAAPVPFYSGAQVVGNILVLSGVGVPDGVQLVAVPLGSFALFSDVTGDGAGDVILALPNATLLIDGRSGRPMGLGVDDNGDGARDLMIFDPDGTTTRIDGRTGIAIVV